MGKISYGGEASLDVEDCGWSFDGFKVERTHFEGR